MALNKAQFQQIHDALLDGYNEFTLRQMVQMGLGEDLDRIAGGKNLEERVFNLMKWADHQHRVQELITAAANDIPTNAKLQALQQAAVGWYLAPSADSSRPTLVKAWRLRRYVATGVVVVVSLISFIYLFIVIAQQLMPTGSPTPTTTRTVAEAPVPTDTPTLASDFVVIINQNANVRSGPGPNYGIVGTATAGQSFVVTGKNILGDWWEINYNGRPGWVYGPLVTAQNTESVAVVNTPALPPANTLPSSTSTPAPTPTPVPDLPTATLEPIEEAVYVDVPAGEFIMGDGQRGQEVHDLFVDNFQIMRTPVTNAQYARCVEAGACKAPINNRWKDPAYANHPVVNVTWQQANAYAQWVGGRLPSEAEWEKACRGTDGRRYPWGNQAPTADQEELGNFFGNIGDTAPVGSYPRGVSPYGVLDMAGNVWEWTSTLWGQREQESDFIYPYDPTDGREDPNVEGYRVVRGGTFNADAYQVRCTPRGRYHSARDFNHVGFRIVFPSTLTLGTLPSSTLTLTLSPISTPTSLASALKIANQQKAISRLRVKG